ncbi:uncharacterized protein LOC113892684 isoform X2 [Bos indicus x Bos taurus]|uniref:uncharacterized protein isoform X2 n=1 Tax=Bos taurus TaxID=9913 RepID=UPI000572BF87|nr:uncharacterized protein LOC104972499 isoform X2 [Bos taurus]XP_019816818.1 PREDICTED: uncharacterized protein LOC109559484 isoform X3 [Bos indicus]XP_027397660.1 uncharacterized protein LOC113892684 isoform X2 [Bos indicus x Bos taurus]
MPHCLWPPRPHPLPGRERGGRCAGQQVHAWCKLAGVLSLMGKPRAGEVETLTQGLPACSRESWDPLQAACFAQSFYKVERPRNEFCHLQRTCDRSGKCSEILRPQLSYVLKKDESCPLDIYFSSLLRWVPQVWLMNGFRGLEIEVQKQSPCLAVVSQAH